MNPWLPWTAPCGWSCSRNSPSNCTRQGIPVIYVTHDQEEAVILGDRLAILHDGVIVQNDTPQQVYAAPANRWVAEFLGMKNFINGRVTSS